MKTFDLDESKQIAKVIERGRVLAEITICKDGLIVEQNKKIIINFEERLHDCKASPEDGCEGCKQI